MVAIKPHCNVNGAVDHFVCTMTNEFCIFIIMSKCHCPTRPVRTPVSSMQWYLFWGTYAICLWVSDFQFL